MGRGEQPRQFRLRAHLMFRNVIGFWACSSPDCLEGDGMIGKVFSQPRFVCDCGSRVLELLYCEHCGEAFLGGHATRGANAADLYLVSTSSNLEGLPETAEQRRTAGSYKLLWPRADSEPIDVTWTRGKGAYTYTWSPATYHPTTGRTTGRGASNAWALDVTAAGSGSLAKVPALPDNCPACGHDSRRDRDLEFEDAGWTNTVVRSMGTGYERVTQVLASALHHRLDTSSVIFSDSRQDAARVNAGVELAHYLDTVRQVVVNAMTEQDESVLAIAHLRGEDSSDPATAAAAKLVGEDRFAGMRMALGSGTPEDEERVRAAFSTANVTNLQRIASRVAPELLRLGINPAGIAVDAQSSRTDERWTELWDWEVSPPRPRAAHDLTPALKTLRDTIETALINQVRLVVFAGQGRDLESLGLARASVNELPQGTARTRS